MPKIICPHCGVLNKCPSCTDYICEGCSEDLEEKETKDEKPDRETKKVG